MTREGVTIIAESNKITVVHKDLDDNQRSLLEWEILEFLRTEIPITFITEEEYNTLYQKSV